MLNREAPRIRKFLVVLIITGTLVSFYSSRFVPGIFTLSPRTGLMKKAVEYLKENFRHHKKSSNTYISKHPKKSERIAVLVSVSTRSLTFDNTSDLFLFKTLEYDYEYIILIGYDRNDAFYDTKRGQLLLDTWIKNAKRREFWFSSCLKVNVATVRVENPLQKPGPVFNEMAKVAYGMGADYIYRINDDTELITTWTSDFIHVLKAFGPPYGVVGPTCNQGNTEILTHDFTSRLHMETSRRCI